jgi:hypothetical protein
MCGEFSAIAIRRQNLYRVHEKGWIFIVLWLLAEHL